MERYREPGGLRFVRSDLVVPDLTNRERTGLSVEHVHYVAGCFATEGFRTRDLNEEEGHDVPVLVDEGGDTVIFAEYSVIIVYECCRKPAL